MSWNLELFDTDPGFYKIDGMTMNKTYPKEALKKASEVEFNKSLQSPTLEQVRNERSSVKSLSGQGG